MLKTCEHCCEHALYYLWLVPTMSIFRPPKFFVPAFICLCSFARKEARKGVEKSLEVCLVWSWMNLRNWDASFQLGSKRALRNKRHTCQTYLDVGLIKEGLELTLRMQQSKNPNDSLKIIPYNNICFFFWSFGWICGFVKRPCNICTPVALCSKNTKL